MNLGLFLFGFLLFLTSVFMILIILVQRGRGGGLTGALGGSGGQSAFGAKAGDTFTRITVVTAIIWIALCMLTIKIFNPVPPPTAAQTDTTIGAGTGDNELPEVIGEDVDDLNDIDPLNPGIIPPVTPDDKTGETPAVVPGGDAGEQPDGGGGDFNGSKAGTEPSADAPKTDAPKTEEPAEDLPAEDSKPAGDDQSADDGKPSDDGN